MLSIISRFHVFAAGGLLVLTLGADLKAATGAAQCSDFSGAWVGSCVSSQTGETWNDYVDIEQADCQNITIFDRDYVVGVEQRDPFYDYETNAEIGWESIVVNWDSNQKILTLTDRGEITGDYPETWNDTSDLFINSQGQLEVVERFNDEWTDTSTTPPTVEHEVDTVSCVYSKK